MIEAGGQATLLAHIFIQTGRTADEIMAKPPGVQAHCFASIRWWLKQQPSPGQGRP